MANVIETAAIASRLKPTDKIRLKKRACQVTGGQEAPLIREIVLNWLNEQDKEKPLNP
jgi:hypothetical protein